MLRSLVLDGGNMQGFHPRRRFVLNLIDMSPVHASCPAVDQQYPWVIFFEDIIISLT